MDRLTEQIILDIIKYEMDIPDGYAWIRNQQRQIPADKGLFVVVGMVDSWVIANNNYAKPVAITPPDPDPPYEGLQEVQETQVRENIQIDIFSSDNSALQRRWEILTALKSVYSEQQQEQYSFRIFRQSSSFANTSSAEGGSMLNRFSIVIPCFVWYRKVKLLDRPGYDYYNNFDTRVDDEQTIGTERGIIEFNIHEEN